jgi:hypothetical protein
MDYIAYLHKDSESDFTGGTLLGFRLQRVGLLILALFSLSSLLSNAYAVDFDHQQLPAVVLHCRLDS